MQVTKVKEGTIVSIVGQNITLRTDEGTRLFRNVPSDLMFLVNGRPTPIQNLNPGMKVSATWVVEEVETVAEEAVKVKAKPPTE